MSVSSSSKRSSGRRLKLFWRPACSRHTWTGTRCESRDRLDVMEVLFRLAREYGLALRAGFRPWIETLQSRGFPTADYDLLDSYGLDAPTKAAQYARLLRELPAGLSEWAVHPGLDTPELLAIEPGRRAHPPGRLRFSGIASRRKILSQAEGIILLDYRALQAIWKER